MCESYQLIDSGNFKKLEQVGPYRLVRPALGAVWSPRLSASEWGQVDAEFLRNASGKGSWNYQNRLPEHWEITMGSLQLVIQLTDFGHLGLFAEQAKNWQLLESRISKWVHSGESVNVLNLFAYTGGSTLASAKGGATVT
ncbi:hypothetical protein OAQ84_01515, partial [Bdellovibrionales bacterium]|nr:hypothetical protein [Bdellovibrionales bacterium]